MPKGRVEGRSDGEDPLWNMQAAEREGEGAETPGTGNAGRVGIGGQSLHEKGGKPSLSTTDGREYTNGSWRGGGGRWRTGGGEVIHDGGDSEHLVSQKRGDVERGGRGDRQYAACPTRGR